MYLENRNYTIPSLESKPKFTTINTGGTKNGSENQIMLAQNTTVNQSTSNIVKKNEEDDKSSQDSDLEIFV